MHSFSAKLLNSLLLFNEFGCVLLIAKLNNLKQAHAMSTELGAALAMLGIKGLHYEPLSMLKAGQDDLALATAIAALPYWHPTSCAVQSLAALPIHATFHSIMVNVSPRWTELSITDIMPLTGGLSSMRCHTSYRIVWTDKRPDWHLKYSNLDMELQTHILLHRLVACSLTVLCEQNASTSSQNLQPIVQQSQASRLPPE